MKPNVIILTSGLTGSSVLTALISQAGYWTGESTFRKRDYDTYENEELITLNLQLFKEADFRGNYLIDFSEEMIGRISQLYGKIDAGFYRSFIAKCQNHQPWIWKDPRLWMTIRFWKNLLEFENCRIILMTRSTVQLWISAMLRGQIRTYRHSRSYERDITNSIANFLNENKLPFLSLQYEQLIRDPLAALHALNTFLHTELTIHDLRRIYRKELYKNPRNSLFNHAKAMLIYAKNYSERLDVPKNPPDKYHLRAR